MNDKSQSRLTILPALQIKTPCPMNWDEMDGDANRRFCGQCQKHVHNFEHMAPDAVANLMNSNQDICARIIRRSDGTIITREPIANQNWFAKWFPKLSTLAASLMALTLSGCQEPQEHATGIVAPSHSIESNAIMGGAVASMGDVAVASRPPTAEPTQHDQRILGKIAPRRDSLQN